MLCRVDTTAADRTLYVAVKCLEDNWQLEIFRIPVLHSQYSKRRLEIDLTAYQNKSVDRYVIHNLCMSAPILEKISFFFFFDEPSLDSCQRTVSDLQSPVSNPRKVGNCLIFFKLHDPAKGKA